MDLREIFPEQDSDHLEVSHDGVFDYLLERHHGGLFLREHVPGGTTSGETLVKHFRSPLFSCPHMEVHAPHHQQSLSLFALQVVGHKGTCRTDTGNDE